MDRKNRDDRQCHFTSNQVPGPWIVRSCLQICFVINPCDIFSKVSYWQLYPFFTSFEKERKKGVPSDLVLHFWTLSSSLHWGIFVLGRALSTQCFAVLIPFICIYYFLALATFEFEPPMYTVIKSLYITRGHHPLLGFYWAFTRLEVDELGTTGPGYQRQIAQHSRFISTAIPNRTISGVFEVRYLLCVPWRSVGECFMVNGQTPTLLDSVICTLTKSPFWMHLGFCKNSCNIMLGEFWVFIL